MEKKNFSGSRSILLASGIVLFLAAVVGGYWFFFMRGFVSTDDARFDGDMVDLAPEIGGRLTEVRVREGDPVKKGEILFVLDKKLPAAAVTQAEAMLAAAQADLSLARANYEKALHGPRSEDIEIAEATAMQIRAARDLEAIELKRAKALYASGAATLEKLNRAQSTFDAAQKQLEAAQHKLRLLKNGTRPEDIAAAKAKVALAEGEVEKAKAALLKAHINLRHTTVRSPFDGEVVRRWKDPGALLRQGTPVLTLFHTATLHVSANIEETQLSRIRKGEPVDISVDAFRDLHLKGHVDKILRATNSEFSLIPAQGVAGTFIKVTQRVRVRIAIDELPEGPSDGPRLGPGMSVEIRIHTRPAGSAPSKTAGNG